MAALRSVCVQHAPGFQKINEILNISNTVFGTHQKNVLYWSFGFTYLHLTLQTVIDVEAVRLRGFMFCVFIISKSLKKTKH